MREAPAIPIIERLLDARRQRCAPTIRRPRQWRDALFGDRIALCEKSYDALTGADALAIVTEWNEFREPDFDKMQSAAEVAGRVRRPQHLLARAHARARLHVFLHWPLTPRRGAGDRRRRLHRQPRLPRRSRAPATASSCFDNLVAGHRAGGPKCGELVEGDISDAAAVA